MNADDAYNAEQIAQAQTHWARVFAGMRGAMTVAAEQTSVELGETIRQELTRQHGEPSAPGQPPAEDSGALVDSITTTVVEHASGAVAVVSVGTDHAVPLEYGTHTMRARPFVRPAVEKLRARLRGIARDAVEGAERS